MGPSVAATAVVVAAFGAEPADFDRGLAVALAGRGVRAAFAAVFDAVFDAVFADRADCLPADVGCDVAADVAAGLFARGVLVRGVVVRGVVVRGVLEVAINEPLSLLDAVH